MAKAPERKKANRTGSALSCYVDDDIRKALDSFIATYNLTAEHHASVRSTVEASLRAYLKEKGFWPPPKK